MITYYINLDTATVRRNKFQSTDYKRFRAIPREEVPEFIDKKMMSMYNFGRDPHLARCGCFLSHTQLLEKIVDEDLHVDTKQEKAQKIIDALQDEEIKKNGRAINKMKPSER